MPDAQEIEKAYLQEVSLEDGQEGQPIGDPIPVQFNPETLKVTISNQIAGQDQRGGPAIQFAGSGTTKLALTLWFDATVSANRQDGQTVNDVRRLTEQVARFMEPEKRTQQGEEGQEDIWIPPGVRFVWGSFLFDGVMESMDENLEYFSPDGRPLRASVAISISQKKFQFEFNPEFSGPSASNLPGTRPQQPAREGDTVQQMAGRSGQTRDWKAIAAVNNIENPRQLAPGTLLNMNIRSR